MKRRSGTLRDILAACLAAILLTTGVHSAEAQEHNLLHPFLMKSALSPPAPRAESSETGAVAQAGSLWGQRTSGLQVSYHRGPVLQSSRTYAIYWGDQSAFPSDLYAGMVDLFTGFGSSPYSNILSEYLPSPTVSQFHGSNLYDTTTAPTRALSRGAVAREICSFIKSGDLPLDPIDRINNVGGVYFLFTSTFPENNVNYCAWHSYATCQGKSIAIAYIPNVSATTMCDPGDMYETSTYSYGTRLYGTVVAHELSEAITDPKLNAWRGHRGDEVGDLCAWQFGPPVTLTSGTAWQLQEEWSDINVACVQNQPS